MIEAALFFKTSKNSYFVVSLSPVATGILVFWPPEPLHLIDQGGQALRTKEDQTFRVFSQV